MYAISEYNSMVERQRRQEFDPRLLGLSIEPFSLSHNTTFASFLNIVKNAKSVEVSHEGDLLREVYVQPDKTVHSYLFNSDGLPVSYVGTSGEGGSIAIRYDASIEYGRAEGLAGNFPKTIEFMEYRSNVLKSREILDIQVSKLNESIDPKICSWASMQPHPGAQLVVNGDAANIKEFWDGARMRPIPVGFQGGNLMATTRAISNVKYYVAITSAIFFAVLIAYRFFRAGTGTAEAK